LPQRGSNRHIEEVVQVFTSDTRGGGVLGKNAPSSMPLGGCRPVGHLSSSALSTATAITALAIAGPKDDERKIRAGVEWLIVHQNADGGWGDTTNSPSNISTTVLVWSALNLAPSTHHTSSAQLSAALGKATAWIIERAGSIAPEAIAATILKRYGKDRTFSVPILTMAALCGRLGPEPTCWGSVISLPFELAVLPQKFFAWLQLPVVSYALPALISMGLARHRRLPSSNPVARWLRNLVSRRALQRLAKIQPSNGGFLEATPLTSFVTMSMAAAGEREHPVTLRCLEFLHQSQRTDGSWPIDTNLSTWVTTLFINSMPVEQARENFRLSTTRQWLLQQQYRTVHPYTGAAPGGWAWTDLPGGVPDADDTSGALLALSKAELSSNEQEQVFLGIQWLLNLQNRDGGIPTFCRGWGALPFDRSSPDISAHALRAWLAWRAQLPLQLQSRIDHATKKATDFLVATQERDGSWIPLWFGNQHTRGEHNKTYGTSRVLIALMELQSCLSNSKAPGLKECWRNALRWLFEAQDVSGGWGGDINCEPSVEETGLALEALGVANQKGLLTHSEKQQAQLGLNWLTAALKQNPAPTPIGLYFAQLWYYEEAYPIIFSTAAFTAWGMQPPMLN
jgi:squalene-hopene/tetraprenyl-beta-curcumene cyclase